MGVVIREWLCRDCGEYFESADSPENVFCPHCTAAEPERVFLTAPAIKSGQTARKDDIQRDLANSYGFSDMTNRDGQAVAARHGQRGPEKSHARWSGEAIGVLGNIPAEHRNSFSQIGRLDQPQPIFGGRRK